MIHQEAYTTAEIPTQEAVARHENATAERVSMIAAIQYRRTIEHGSSTITEQGES